VVEAVENLQHSYETTPQVRVGIATGPAVVGDVLSTDASERGEMAALGPTPNLAARLQGEADANTVVISETTQSLTSGLFELEALPPQTLKGISGEVTPYRVCAEVRGQSRFAARSGMRFSPFVGREEELELLARRWTRANEGRGQAVLIVGEAGIGKSRLVQRLRERIGAGRHEAIHVQCSPYYENSALFPLVAAFERALGSAGVADPDLRLERLRRHLADMDAADEESLGVLAHLLSLPVEGRFPQVESMDGKQRRERTLQILVEYLEKRAVRLPVLCVFEDLHWTDSSTKELLGRLVEAIDKDRVMLVATTRPGFDAAWRDLAHASVLSLSRLGREESEQLTQAVASTSPEFPAEVVQGILARAGGIPLYIEELTRTVMQSSESSFNQEIIPATLQDSLTSRLDASAEGKAVAQCASVFGRSFDRQLLKAIWRDAPERLDAGLKSLTHSELVYAQGESEESRYVFKHALIRDAAYASLLREHRAALHQQAAEALELHSPGVADSQPAMLAQHYAMAGNTQRAIEYWRRAGRVSARNNAFVEAETCFQAALELLKEMPSSNETMTRDAELLLDLGTAQMTIHGYGSEQAASTYARARDVAARVKNPVHAFEATWGLWFTRHIAGDWEGARDLLDDIERHAAASGQIGNRLQAHHAAWTTCLILGDPESAFTHTERGREAYSVEEHGDHAHRYGGHDPGVCCGAHSGVVGWLLGHVDRAHAGWKDAMQLTERLGHRPSTGIAQFFGGMMFQFRREPEAVLELAENTVNMTPHHDAFASILRGWALAALGDSKEGLREYERGLEAYRQSSAGIRQGYINYLAADVYETLGRRSDALDALDNAVDRARLTGDSWWYPELLRARVSLRASASPYNRKQLFDDARAAIDAARRQHSKSLELRATLTLSRMLRDDGRSGAALEILEPVFEWFTEGLQTPDLLQAKALLEELR